MADHEIKISLVNGTHAVPDLKNRIMRVGETVRYFSDHGAVTLVFESSPFKGPADIVQGNQTLTLERVGVFFCKCFITTADGTFGWHLNEVPESGGDHDVRP